MTGTFFGLNIALLGIQAQRSALNVTAHNVANANTEGYSRQEAVMQATTPFPLPGSNNGQEAGQIGTGVDIKQIRRVRDNYVDIQLRNQQCSLGEWNVASGYLSEIETVLNEPSDAGINKLMTKMFNAWQDLNSDPSSYAARAAVVQQSSVLADTIRRDYEQLSTLRTQADKDVSLKTSDVNDWLGEISALNKQISQVQITGNDANDLRDQRDLLIDKLSKTVKVGYQEQTDGTMTVWLNDPSTPPVASDTDQSKQILVSGATRHYLMETSWDASTPGSGSVVWDGDGDISTAADQTAAAVTSGELKALVEVRDVTTNPFTGAAVDHPESLAWRLDQLAKTLISSVNTLHSAGHGLQADDANAANFFAKSDGSGGYTACVGASDIQVNPLLEADPNKIRAATSGVNMPGDGGNALAIAQLTNKTNLSFGGQQSSLANWYSALITKLGVDSSEAQTMTSNQQLLVDHLTVRRDEQSGVSLDEEATNMIKYQRAYEASSRVMTAMDEMLDRIINGMGRVGL